MTGLGVVLLAIVAAAGAAVASGLIRFGTAVEDKYSAKLASIQDHAMSLEDIELSKPFRERFLVPLRERLEAFMVARTPASRQEQLKLLILSAGEPMHATVTGVLVAKVVSAAAGTALAGLVTIGLLHFDFPWFLLTGAGLAGGWILPDQWLRQRASSRRRQIQYAIPDAIDLLTICLDAGLSFDPALQRVAENLEGPLAEEFDLLQGEIRYGRPRFEALEGMAERLGVEDMTVFVQAVVQSNRLGVALGDTVRIQAAEIRRRRRQRAEEMAAQAPLKMLFPMVGCIFPTLFIALMGPVVLVLVSRH